MSLKDRPLAEGVEWGGKLKVRESIFLTFWVMVMVWVMLEIVFLPVSKFDLVFARYGAIIPADPSLNGGMGLWGAKENQMGHEPSICAA